MRETKCIRPSNATLFALMWAIYLLIHQLKQTPWPTHVPISLGVVRLAMVGVAIAFLCRPRKAAWFCAMVGLQVASVTIELPVMSNCWLFTGIVNFGILAAAWRASRAKSGPFQTLEIEDIYQHAAPMLRVSLILLYAFAALAKYNSDFFRVDVSAAAYFAKVMLESNVALSFMSEWTSVGLSAIGVTVFAETAIPLMLLMPRMRRYAVLMGMVFHTVLAHNPNVSVFDFSAMMFALYVTFVPEDFFEKLTTNSKTRWVCVLAEYRGWILSALVLASLVTIIGPPYTALQRFRVGLWLIFGLSCTVLAIRILFSGNRNPRANLFTFRLKGVADFVVLALVTINSLSPYIGLKTGVAFTMFSNLRTEAGHENHLFIPSWWRLFGYQEEEVRLLASSAEELNAIAQRDESLLQYDLRLRAARYPQDSVCYERNGVVVNVPRIKEDTFLGNSPPYLARKLLFFRPIQSTRNKSWQW